MRSGSWDASSSPSLRGGHVACAMVLGRGLLRGTVCLGSLVLVHPGYSVHVAGRETDLSTASATAGHSGLAGGESGERAARRALEDFPVLRLRPLGGGTTRPRTSAFPSAVDQTVP